MPGRNATYNTVAMLDTETNKIVDLSIVHVKVCSYIDSCFGQIIFSMKYIC